MKLKKAFMAFAFCATLATITLPNAANAAHSRHYRGGKAYASCTIKGCTKTSVHRHHGVRYSGHYTHH